MNGPAKVAKTPAGTAEKPAHCSPWRDTPFTGIQTLVYATICPADYAVVGEKPDTMPLSGYRTTTTGFHVDAFLPIVLLRYQQKKTMLKN